MTRENVFTPSPLIARLQELQPEGDILITAIHHLRSPEEVRMFGADYTSWLMNTYPHLGTPKKAARAARSNIRRIMGYIAPEEAEIWGDALEGKTWNQIRGHMSPRADVPRETREHNGGGIKFFSGHALPPYDQMIAAVTTVTPERLRDARVLERRVWRPEETLEAAEFFFKAGRVNIVGSPQAGKGTILYGLSEICHRFHWGYLFVDGHYQETPAEEVIAALQEAEKRNIPVFYDAFDHNFGGAASNDGGIRKIGHVKQRARTTAIVEALGRLNVPVAITNHDEEWATAFLDREFRESLSDHLSKYPAYHIPLGLRSVKTAVRYLIDHGMTMRNARIIVSMGKTPYAIDELTRRYGDKDVVREIIEASMHFPVLKELVRPGNPENTISAGRKEEVDEAFVLWDFSRESAIGKLGDIIREAEMKRIFLTRLRRTAKADNKVRKRERELEKNK